MRSIYVPPDTLKRVARFMKPVNALALRVSAATGLRIGDVLKLQRSALQGATLRYTAAKTGKQGEAALPPAVVKALKTAGNSEYFFPGRKPGTTRTRQAVYRDMKRACERANVAGQVSPHSARKVYAVELRKRDGVAAVQAALQHSNRETTLSYAYADLVGADMLGIEAERLELLAEMIAEKVVKLLRRANECSGIDEAAGGVIK